MPKENVSGGDMDSKSNALSEISQSRLEEIIKSAQGELAKIIVDAQGKLGECSTVVTQVAAAKAKITDEQAVIATKSDHIQKAQEHADGVRASLDRALTAAMQHVTAAEGHKSEAQSSADVAAELLADVRTTKGAVETDGMAIITARKSAEESASLTKGLADRSSAIEARLAAYEKRLTELDKQCATQLKTIEGLLPGATSAGLASSFNNRRMAFLKPQNRWQWLFIGSVLAIVAVTFTGFIHSLNLTTPPTYEELSRLWLTRLPLMGALVWLAMHSSHEAALAKRLEEDYGYKAAISSCFEGFKEQMSSIDADVAPDSALANLLKNTLETIATPPGRIYEKHALAVSPTSELAEVAKVTNVLPSIAKKV